MTEYTPITGQEGLCPKCNQEIAWGKESNYAGPDATCYYVSCEWCGWEGLAEYVTCFSIYHEKEKKGGDAGCTT